MGWDRFGSYVANVQGASWEEMVRHFYLAVLFRLIDVVHRLSCLKAAGYKRGVSIFPNRHLSLLTRLFQIKVVSHYMTQIDEQETRSLAHIVCIYPAIVKEKALQVAAENNIPLS